MPCSMIVNLEIANYTSIASFAKYICYTVSCTRTVQDQTRKTM